MKILIVYYSRTNITKNIAESIQMALNCDIEEIMDNGKYRGRIGYIKGGFDAAMGRASEINPISKNPKNYDLVIIGTPVWASNMAAPIYTYLMEHKKEINNIAAFCTCMGGGYSETLNKISEVLQKNLIATMYLNSKDIENPEEKIKNFINMIK